MKKGQISIFIIIAIVIVFVLIILIVLFPKIQNDSIKYDASPEYLLVKDCIEREAIFALYDLSQTGMYFESKRRTTAGNISYYLYGNTSLVPSKDVIQKEISNYIETYIPSCIRYLEVFNASIKSAGKVNARTIIEDNLLKVYVTLPITLEKKGKTIQLKNFGETAIPARLGIIYDSLKTAINEQLEFPDQICLSCFDSVAKQNNYSFEIWDYNDNETVIMTLIDEESDIYRKEGLIEKNIRIDFAMQIK